MATEYSAAFFWSPDGTKLLSLRPEVEERLLFRWNVWEDGSSFSTDRFVPSLELSRDYFQFFEQHAQSMTLWSPDGSAFVYAGQQAESGESGVWIQPATTDDPRPSAWPTAWSRPGHRGSVRRATRARSRTTPAARQEACCGSS